MLHTGHITVCLRIMDGESKKALEATMVGVFVFCFLEFLESHEWLRKPITKYYKRSINTDTPGQDSHLFWAVLWFWRRL